MKDLHELISHQANKLIMPMLEVDEISYSELGNTADNALVIEFDLTPFKAITHVAAAIEILKITLADEFDITIRAITIGYNHVRTGGHGINRYRIELAQIDQN